MFPSNTVNYIRIGGRFDYKPKYVKGLSAHLTAGYVLAGRNMGQATSVSIGVGYAFGIWKTGGAKKAAKNQAQLQAQPQSQPQQTPNK